LVASVTGAPRVVPPRGCGASGEPSGQENVYRDGAAGAGFCGGSSAREATALNARRAANIAMTGFMTTPFIGS
jgi:hypothetical protein